MQRGLEIFVTLGQRFSSRTEEKYRSNKKRDSKQAFLPEPKTRDRTNWRKKNARTRPQITQSEKAKEEEEVYSG